MTTVGESGRGDARLRIGIDVGGTFTDVVAVDAHSFTLVDMLKVPTSHGAPEGVARGIIDALEGMLARLASTPEQVVFIAHSTTQATNALLEGDVARVGIVGVGSGLEGWKARRDTRVPPITLAPGKVLAPVHAFTPAAGIAPAVDALVAAGVEVVVASEAFGVDDPAVERAVVDAARARGLLATAGHEVSSLYGLRTRTRTATLNAAILPRMVETATLTAECVTRAGIAAPLMIMRSDGGVMTVDEVRRRPILTMLSGPAAGIAGALMHERVSDGIFIEVGGTSADVSVIRDGQPQVRPARVGGHRTFLTMLDVRTLAIAGGSLVRVGGGRVIDVGPRSAHIAALGYACFTPRGAIDERARLVTVQPRPGDADDYVAIETPDGARHALTPTCAANALGLVAAEAFARSDPETARAALDVLARHLRTDTTSAARAVLDVAGAKLRHQIEQLLDEYALDRGTLELVGGGGGAASLVPYVGDAMGVSWRLAARAEVISPIGVALAMVRDSVERNIVNPTPADVLRVRQEAIDAAVRAGALAETVDVQVQVDRQRHLVRATAIGTAELRRRTREVAAASDDERIEAAARSLHVSPGDVRCVGRTSHLAVFASDVSEARLFGLWRRAVTHARVVDLTGVVRLQRRDVIVRETTAGHSEATLRAILTAMSAYGDAGREVPDVHLLAGSRIISLAGLSDDGQVLGLAAAELRGLAEDEPIVLLATRRAG